MSGLDDIRIGDVVVCVDLKPSRAGWVPTTIKLGGIYRVSAIRIGWHSDRFLDFPGSPEEPGKLGYHDWRFRKLDAAEDCFTQAMRDLLRQGVDE